MKTNKGLPERFRWQRGYIVGQSVMAATLATGLLGAVGTDWSAQMSLNASLQAQTAASAQINTAVGVYMTLYYMTLADIATIPGDCEQLPYRSGAGPASSSGSSGPPPACSAELGYKKTNPDGSTQVVKYTVPNVLQPTLADLKALNLLDSSVAERPIVPVSTSVTTGPKTNASSPAPMENRYGIVITRTTLPSGVSLNSLVFNVQPYQLSREDYSQLVRLSNGQAGGSGLPDAGSTQSSLNPDYLLAEANKAWTYANPVRQTINVSGSGPRDIGVPGIVAWRNGFDASVALQLMRRDGSTPPTGDWDFAGYNITHIHKLSAQSLATSGNLDVGGDLTVKGTLNVLKDLVVQGTTTLQTLVVAGPAIFSGPVTVNNDVNIKSGKSLTVGTGDTATVVNATGVKTGTLTTLGLRTSANGTLLGAAGAIGVDAGSACAENNALAQQNVTGQLLMCRSNIWGSVFNATLTAVDLNSRCTPEGSMGILTDGTVVTCAAGKWQIAGDLATPGSNCKTRGALARSITPQGVANLLVCDGTRWSTDIYARPKTVDATQGSSCRSDEVNALARNKESPTSGFLMCVSDSLTGTASWQSPFGQFDEYWVDEKEYLSFTFRWLGWRYAGLGYPYWGQVIIGPAYDSSLADVFNYNPREVCMVHMKDGAELGRRCVRPTLSCGTLGGGCVTGDPGGVPTHSVLSYYMRDGGSSGSDGTSLGLDEPGMHKAAWTAPRFNWLNGTNNDYGNAMTDMHWSTSGASPSYDYFELYFYRPDMGTGDFEVRMNRIHRRKYVTVN